MTYIFSHRFLVTPPHPTPPGASPKFTLLRRSRIKILLSAVSIRYPTSHVLPSSINPMLPASKTSDRPHIPLRRNLKATPLSLTYIPYLLISLFIPFFAKSNVFFIFRTTHIPPPPIGFGCQPQPLWKSHCILSSLSLDYSMICCFLPLPKITS